MDLLKYEFNSPEGSHLFNIGQLVKKIRHYTNDVPAHEFKAAIPELQSLERKLQIFDGAVAGTSKRNYIQEIMDELQKEAEIEPQLMELIVRSAKVIISELCRTDFLLDDFGYEFRKSEAVYWLEFYGYKEKKLVDEVLLKVKDVFCSTCYKYGIIFIDSTLNEN